MQKIVSKIIKYFEYVLIICILFISVLVTINFIQLNIMKKDYTNFVGYSIFKVISDSMAPKIVKNDVIIVKINDKIQKGDIITYKLKNDFITHRVIDIKNDEYITRGDSNNVGDSPISKDKVVGKVIKIIPKLGIWKDILMTPKIFILLIVTVLLFSSSFKDWTMKQYKKYKDYRITSDSIIEGRNKDE